VPSDLSPPKTRKRSRFASFCKSNAHPFVAQVPSRAGLDLTDQDLQDLAAQHVTDNVPLRFQSL
jgi:hypothetical protein